MCGFQRARSDDQREQRRRAVLDTAREMLATMPVAEISLNELSRRVGLAKSNVLRYFESREAVLLELQDQAWSEWLDALAAELPDAVDAAAPVATRTEALAAALTASLGARPMLCELISTTAAVLERNVSPEVAARYKRRALVHVERLAGLLRVVVPELDAWSAGRLAAATALCTGALWTHACPSDALLAVYAQQPDLAVLRVHFPDALREMIATLVAGLLARGGVKDGRGSP
ncbi:TetR family transcriptional regulator [Pseudonocardia sp.]|uniref:TetR/AcrR family transcriptional regulator n=1 Tax=Pseudonocardia sp. TaxID=60912 RepID=UPI003D10E12E